MFLGSVNSVHLIVHDTNNNHPGDLTDTAVKTKNTGVQLLPESTAPAGTSGQRDGKHHIPRGWREQGRMRARRCRCHLGRWELRHTVTALSSVVSRH